MRLVDRGDGCWFNLDTADSIVEVRGSKDQGTVGFDIFQSGSRDPSFRLVVTERTAVSFRRMLKNDTVLALEIPEEDA